MAENGEGGIVFRVDGQGSSASLVISASVDPQMVQVDLLMVQARGAGLAVDGDFQERLRACVAQYAANPRATDTIVSQAKLPVDGDDGWLEWEPGCDVEHAGSNHAERSAAMSAKTDFYNISTFVRVTPGQKVAMIHAPTPGTDGHDVHGRVINAKAGKVYNVKVDKSLSVSTTGAVAALEEGVLQLRNNQLRIVRLLEIPRSVDFSTGNIKFQGSVVVREGVCNAFTVDATEDLTVEGLVEAATIVCGRNLSIRRGMAAKDHGQLVCNGNADIGYLNNVKGMVKGTLHVKREIMNCELAIGGDLLCENGTIIGGRCVITGSLKAGQLGSEADTPTILVLAAMPLLSVQIKRLTDAIKLLTVEQEKLKQKHQTFLSKSAGMTAQEKEQLTELSFETADVESKINDARQKQAQLAESARSQRKLDVVISKLIYPRVRMLIGDKEVTFQKLIRGPIRIGWDEGRHLNFSYSDGAVRPISDIAREMRTAA